MHEIMLGEASRLPQGIALESAIRMRRARERTVPRGFTVYRAGDAGGPLRLLQGLVRLDAGCEPGSPYTGLASAGDLIGAECLQDGRYAYTVTALVPCRLSAEAEWPDDGALLADLVRAERRRGEAMALSRGAATERFARLLQLLAAADPEQPGRLALPRRSDMADLTALTMETVSRLVASLRRAGVLRPCELPGVPRDSAFQVCPEAIAALLEPAPQRA